MCEEATEGSTEGSVEGASDGLSGREVPHDDTKPEEESSCSLGCTGAGGRVEKLGEAVGRGEREEERREETRRAGAAVVHSQ